MSISLCLQRVMEFIEEGKNWVDGGNYLIFGSSDYWRATQGDARESSEPDEEDQKEPMAWAKLMLQLKTKYVPLDLSLSRSLSAVTQFLRSQDGEQLVETAMADYLIKQLPEFTERSRHLDVLEVDVPIYGEAEEYFREATLCYFFGLRAASILLARSALELVLERKLADEVPHFGSLIPDKDKGRFQWLIDLAGSFSVLKDEKRIDLTVEAHRFRRYANDVVHEARIPTDDENRRYLESLRILLSVIMQKRTK